MIDFAAAREAMVDCQVRPSDVTRFPIIEAMLAVPREEFVPEALRPVAYLGEHVRLGGGRVVLDPRVFAKMLDALNPGPEEAVLDIGCGMGYSAAVIAHMAGSVVAVEEAADLAEVAKSRTTDVTVHVGPLVEGMAASAPYDAIMIEGAIECLPPAIEEQLKPGGRIVAIFAEGRRGQARLGLKLGGGIAWRRIFDASAPTLPGFKAVKAFEF